MIKCIFNLCEFSFMFTKHADYILINDFGFYVRVYSLCLFGCLNLNPDIISVQVGTPASYFEGREKS